MMKINIEICMSKWCKTIMGLIKYKQRMQHKTTYYSKSMKNREQSKPNKTKQIQAHIVVNLSKIIHTNKIRDIFLMTT